MPRSWAGPAPANRRPCARSGASTARERRATAATGRRSFPSTVSAPCWPARPGATESARREWFAVIRFWWATVPPICPGIEELEALIAGGAALVATADLIHHGVGYGTPLENCLPTEDPRAQRFAEETARANLGWLAARDYGQFLRHGAEIRSDFRDGGPVATHLLSDTSTLQGILHTLALVDYADTLQAPAPTWVAGALASLRPVAIHR